MTAPGAAPLLFVYGTLRRAIGRGPYAALEQAAEYLGAAALPGRLYDLGNYPGAVIITPADSVLAHRVCGELYRLPDESMLETLDVYEGCAPGQPLPHQYRRIRAEVTRCDGTRCIAWCYHYQGETAGLRLIPDGDYVAHRHRAAPS